MAEAPTTRIVVPCYNEGSRLDGNAFLDYLAQQPSVGFVFVNDGSHDETLKLLQELAAREPGRVEVVDQQPNQGKAAAVRTGMLRAFELQCDYAGYWDADLATPLDEIMGFVGVLQERPGLLMVFGARVALLGRSIERRAARHYLGRVFATAASNLLGLPVYDTQCGAKLLRVNEDSRRLFAAPFLVNWTFDVELIARLIRMRRSEGSQDPADEIYELPLRRWHDVAGSKVRARDFARALLEMWRIRHSYLRRAAPELPAGQARALEKGPAPR